MREMSIFSISLKKHKKTRIYHRYKNIFVHIKKKWRNEKKKVTFWRKNRALFVIFYAMEVESLFCVTSILRLIIYDIFPSVCRWLFAKKSYRFFLLFKYFENKFFAGCLLKRLAVSCWNFVSKSQCNQS